MPSVAELGMNLLDDGRTRRYAATPRAIVYKVAHDVADLVEEEAFEKKYTSTTAT